MTCSVHLSSSLKAAKEQGDRFSYLPTSTRITRIFQVFLPSCKKEGKEICSKLQGRRRRRLNVVSPSVITKGFDILNAFDDEYNGVIIDSEGLPSSPNSFSSLLRSSLSHWKQRGKNGVWLKIMARQAHLVPIAIKVIATATWLNIIYFACYCFVKSYCTCHLNILCLHRKDLFTIMQKQVMLCWPFGFLKSNPACYPPLVHIRLA